MKQRCPSCGAKNDSGEEKCVRCGYVLYESSFGDIADELEKDMANVSLSELP